MKKLLIGLCASLGLGLSAQALAVTINFDDPQANFVPTPGVIQEITNQFAPLGVVFRDVASHGHGAIVGRCGPGEGTGALFGYGNDFAGCGSTVPNLDIVFVNPANASQGGYTTAFSIYNYDGLIRATAYDASGQVLGTTEKSSGLLSFNGVGNIARVNLRSLDYDPTTMDTLTFNEVSAVPEPSTYAMLLAGVGLLAGMTRRRKA